MRHEWVLGEDSHSGVYLCRRIRGGRTRRKWESVAQVIGFKNGAPDVWLKDPRTFFQELTVIRDVPEEERVAILLRALQEAPF